MNESGRSVAPALRFCKLPPERLVVVHDELDLELGDVRAKQGGGLAGHNGLRSLAGAIGTQDFLRVRIGIGRPERGDRGRWPTGCCSRSDRAPMSTPGARRRRLRAVGAAGGRGRGDARRGTGSASGVAADAPS